MEKNMEPTIDPLGVPVADIYPRSQPPCVGSGQLLSPLLGALSLAPAPQHPLGRAHPQTSLPKRQYHHKTLPQTNLLSAPWEGLKK